MFLRIRKNRASLVQTYRQGGKVRHRHLFALTHLSRDNWSFTFDILRAKQLTRRDGCNAQHHLPVVAGRKETLRVPTPNDTPAQVRNAQHHLPVPGFFFFGKEPVMTHNNERAKTLANWYASLPDVALNCLHIYHDGYVLVLDGSADRHLTVREALRQHFAVEEARDAGHARACRAGGDHD
jgi:hypothetical protein